MQLTNQCRSECTQCPNISTGIHCDKKCAPPASAVTLFSVYATSHSNSKPRLRTVELEKGPRSCKNLKFKISSQQLGSLPQPKHRGCCLDAQEGVPGTSRKQLRVLRGPGRSLRRGCYSIDNISHNTSECSLRGKDIFQTQFDQMRQKGDNVDNDSKAFELLVNTAIKHKLFSS